ncbi:MAG: protein adenylyltransferase SelO family protein [Myxococcota bacterium]|nr:protein adenylyltransferase SelO family protein [Myxococcota bacterium]
MPQTDNRRNRTNAQSFSDFIQHVDYSLMTALNADPAGTSSGDDHEPRQVFTGHYVPVTPTPISSPEYIAHSTALFDELGLSQALAHDPGFSRLFSGDLSATEKPMRPFGWATGYALSIYGTEYTQQCPFGTGNGYGDGRAISVFEGLFKGKRWEMQLKGGGKTPYCRGADGRAVLRSSIREFLAQEFMHALGVPTSRSLTLYVSQTDTVMRPWYTPNSKSINPDVMVSNPVAITTRVAPSFLRVGQLELFARRARAQTHPGALDELHMIVTHLIERNYRDEIASDLTFAEQVVHLAQQFRTRLVRLVANWIRVGYCQGNFNSDNCAAGGFTLDYGPFGFCELFDPRFQPWTGGGDHFSFLNQPAAAETNFHMFWTALRPLLADRPEALTKLDQIREGFADAMTHELERMWAGKLGLSTFDPILLKDLLRLMLRTHVDYTLFFQVLSDIPETVSAFTKSFYEPTTQALIAEWETWLARWRHGISSEGDANRVSDTMKRSNPCITWREWLIAPAYQRAQHGDYTLVRELHDILSHPYRRPPPQLADKYDQLKPRSFFNTGGVSHYSCSS